VQPDGSLGVSERLEVAFSGDFHYGYRDIPLRPGESFARPSVVERGVAYRQGRKTDLEPGPLRTFGVGGTSLRVASTPTTTTPDATTADSATMAKIRPRELTRRR